MKWKQKATSKCLRPQHPLRSSTGLKTAPYSIKSKGFFFLHEGMRMIFLIDPEGLSIFRPIDFMVVCIPGSSKTSVCVCFCTCSAYACVFCASACVCPSETYNPHLSWKTWNILLSSCCVEKLGITLVDISFHAFSKINTMRNTKYSYRNRRSLLQLCQRLKMWEM